MLLLMDGTLMRGDDARRIQLCDLFVSEVEHTRSHPAVAIGAVTDQGKVNRVSNHCIPYGIANTIHCTLTALQLLLPAEWA